MKKVALIVVAVLGLVGAHAGSMQRSDSPNVVIILADDLGYGDLGCYGHDGFKTPHLDQMAEEGARLNQFYVPVPYCAPSRATLLTGRYPFRTGMVFNPSPDSGINDIGLADEELTLGEAFQEAGYATSHIGKWHLGHQPRFYPRRHGFDEYYGILYSNDMRPVELIENEKVVEYPVVQATLTKRYTERALEFIERQQDRPFLLYLAHAMPHKPLAPSADFYATSAAGLYGDVVAELDWSVGQILEKLKELGLEQNTLVIFTSDNGPWYGGSTGGLRGMKGRTWEGGLRVPMIARWPGQIPAGLVSEAPAGIVDVFPTVLKRAGIDVTVNRRLDGRDIWPLMTRLGAESPHDLLLALQGPHLATIRSGRWKLHVRSPGGVPDRGQDWVDPRGPDGVTILAPYEQSRPSEYPGVLGGDDPHHMMLFDLETDPAEQHDVASRHPEVAKRLKAQFDRINMEVPRFQQPSRIPLQRPGPRPSP